MLTVELKLVVSLGLSLLSSFFSFIWIFIRRQKIFNELSDHAKTADKYSEFIGVLFALIKSLGLLGILLLWSFVMTFTAMIFRSLEFLVLPFDLIFYIAASSFPFFFFWRREIFECVLDSLETPSRRDDFWLILVVTLTSTGIGLLIYIVSYNVAEIGRIVSKLID